MKESKSIEKKLLYFRRNLRELEKHLKDIVNEGVSFFIPCDFNDFDEFLEQNSHNSAMTFIYSYDELETPGDKNELIPYIQEYIQTKYKMFYRREWKDRECD